MQHVEDLLEQQNSQQLVASPQLMYQDDVTAQMLPTSKEVYNYYTCETKFYSQNS